MNKSKYLIFLTIIIATFALSISVVGTANASADNVTFEVLDNEEEPIENATVMLIDSENNQVTPKEPGHNFLPDLENFGVTDENGEVYYENIGADNYQYIVGKTGYEFVLGENNVISDNTISVKMKKPENSYNANFTVKNSSGEPIENAMAMIGIMMGEDVFPYLGDLANTDNQGKVTFENLEPENYAYMFGKEGYQSVENVMEVTGDRTENITLEKTYDVTFNVENEDNVNIQGATVRLHGVGEGETDENGEVVFKGVPKDNYLYDVEKEGYLSVFHGEVEVDNDVTESVTLKGVPDLGHTSKVRINPIENLDNTIVNFTLRIEHTSGHLFVIDDPVIREALNDENITEMLKSKYEEEGYPLSENAFVTVHEVDKLWSLTDENKGYDHVIKNPDIEEEGNLDVYDNSGFENAIENIELVVPYQFTITENTSPEGWDYSENNNVITYSSTAENELGSGENISFEFSAKTPKLPDDSPQDYFEVKDWFVNTIDNEGGVNQNNYKTIVFSEMYSFDGYAYNQDGENVSNAEARVTVWRNNPNSDRHGLITDHISYSNENGYFKINDIPGYGNMFRPKITDKSDNLISFNPYQMPNDVFAGLGTVDFFMENAVTINLSIYKNRPLDANKNARIDENYDVDNYSHNLEWISEENKWAYVDNQGELVILNSEFSENKIVEIPMENVGEISYWENGIFLAENIQNGMQSEVDFGVIGFYDNGDSIFELDNLSGRYHGGEGEIRGLEVYDDYLYVSGMTGESERVVDKYDDILSSPELLENNIEGDAEAFGKIVRAEVNRAENYWYVLENGQPHVVGLGTDWGKYPIAGAKLPTPLNGFARNDSSWYYASENTGKIYKITMYCGDFEYSLWDRATGKVLDQSFPDFVENKTFYLPASRDYGFDVHGTLSGGHIHYIADNLKENPSWQDDRTIDVKLDSSDDLKMLSGHVTKPDGNTGFDNLAIVPFRLGRDKAVVEWPDSVDRAVPWNLGTDNFVPENGYYEFWRPSNVYGEEWLLFFSAYDKSEDNYYGGISSVKLYNDNERKIRCENLTLYPLSGDLKEISLKSFEYGDITVPTSLKQIQYQKKNGENDYPYLSRAKIDYSTLWGNMEPVWLEGSLPLESDSEETNTEYNFPIFENVGIEKLEAYSVSGMRKISLSADRMSGENEVEVELYPFEIRGIDDQDLSNIKFEIYRNEPQYNVPNPASEGLLWDADEEEFNPWTVMLGGGDISFRIIKEDDNIAVHYNNVNLLRSGPPDALFDTEPTVEDMADIWRFGTMGPDIYDNILVGMPYDETEYSEEDNFLIRIRDLYDDNWNSIWNIENDAFENIPEEYSAYKEEPYRAYVDNSMDPIYASKDDQTSIAYVDNKKGMVWMRIPHFSGVSPYITYETAAEEFSLEINTSGSGTTDPSVGTHLYKDGEEVTVKAYPDSGWEFVEWTGDKTGTDNVVSVIMNEDKNITAVFEEVEEPEPSPISPSPAEFTVSDLKVSPAVVEPGEQVNISVEVSNVGVDSGSHKISLLVSDENEGTKTISLDSGSSTRVSFTFAENEPGTHSVSVGGLTGEFIVYMPDEAESQSKTNVGNIEAGTAKDITLENSSMTSLRITAKNSVTNVSIILHQFTDTPSGVSPPSDESYRYINIGIENMVYDDFENVTMAFQVEKAWVSNNEIDENTIGLKRYNPGDDQWENIQTTLVDEDETNYYFEAFSDHLSTFAVTGQKMETETNEPWGITVGIIVVVVLVTVGIWYWQKQSKSSGEGSEL